MSLLGQPGNRAHRQTRSLFQQLSLPLGTQASAPLAAGHAPVLGRVGSRLPTSQADSRNASPLSVSSV